MANNQLFDSLQLRGFLSFGPGSEAVKLTGLNVLIGPNGAGKSNFIEAVELLRATPTDFAGAMRMGGLPGDWIWHGTPACSSAKIDAVLAAKKHPKLHYGIEFTDSRGRLEIVDEVLDSVNSTPGTVLYYTHTEVLASKNGMIDPRQSVFSRKKDYERYPEITETGGAFQQHANS